MAVKFMEIMCKCTLNRSPSDFFSYQVTFAVPNWRMTYFTPRWPLLMHNLGWDIWSMFYYVSHLADISYPVLKLESRLEVGLQHSMLCGTSTFLLTLCNGWVSPQSNPWPPLIPITSLWLTTDLMKTHCWKNKLYFLFWGFWLVVCFLLLAKWVYGQIIPWSESPWRPMNISVSTNGMNGYREKETQRTLPVTLSSRFFKSYARL